MENKKNDSVPKILERICWYFLLSVGVMIISLVCSMITKDYGNFNFNFWLYTCGFPLVLSAWLMTKMDDCKRERDSTERLIKDLDRLKKEGCSEVCKSKHVLDIVVCSQAQKVKIKVDEFSLKQKIRKAERDMDDKFSQKVYDICENLFRYKVSLTFSLLLVVIEFFIIYSKFI